MKRNLHDIDKLFRDGLDDHTEPAPPGAWDAINSDLDKKQAVVFREKYIRLRRLAVAMLLFIFAGIACLLYVVKTGNQHTGVAQTKTAAHNKNNGTAANNKAVDTKEITNNEGAATAGAGKIKQNNTAIAPAAANAGVPEKVVATTSAKENQSIATGSNLHTQTFSEAEIKLAAALTANKQHSVIKNGNNKLHQQKLSKNKIVAGNEHDAFVTATGKGRNSLSSAEWGSESGDKQSADKIISNLTDNKRRSAVTNGKTETVNDLIAYTAQAPLFMNALEAATPGPLVAINNAPFLYSIITNDSLVKAAAIAKKKTVSKHPVSLMVFGSPNHSFRRLEDDRLLAGPGRDKRVAERDERRESSFSAGILVNYGLSKKIIVQSGIVFTSAKTSISPKIIYARPDYNGHTKYEFNCSAGYSYISPKTGTTPAIGDSVKVMGTSSTINYIGIPVSINYVWQKGHLLIKPGVGVSINFLTSSNATTNLGNWAGNKQAVASIRGLKNVYLDASVGLGAEWMVSKRIAIGMRPMLRMALTSINKNTPVRAYQNFMSLETGLKINL